jgi:type I restriction enzyme S subunit
VSEIRWTQLENAQTIGAEYYAPTYLGPVAGLISSVHPKHLLGELCSRITDGDHGSAEYTQNGVPFVLSEAVNEVWIDPAKCRTISSRHAASLKRSQLRTGDVLVTKTGVYFGKSAVVQPNFDGANTIAHVGILRPGSTINPYFLSTFLNSSFGQAQLRRRGIKSTRPEIKLIEFSDILIPTPSPLFQMSIEGLVTAALAEFDSSRFQFQKADLALVTAIGLASWQPPSHLTCVRSFSEVKQHARMDAEHYREEFYAAIRCLKEAGAIRLVPMDELLVSLTNGHTPLHHNLDDGEVPFLCAEHVANFQVHYGSEKRILLKHHLSELSRTALRNGDVLLTIKGRVGNAALVDHVTGPVNINQDVALLRLNNKLPIWYVLAFINSAFGQLQVKQLSTGAINPFLGLANVRRLQIPEFALELMQRAASETKGLIESARNTKTKAQNLLAQARRAVEIVIEDSEAAALEYLRER